MVGGLMNFLLGVPGSEVGVGQEVHPFWGEELLVGLAGLFFGAVGGEEYGPCGAYFVFSLLALAVLDFCAETTASCQ